MLNICQFYFHFDSEENSDCLIYATFMPLYYILMISICHKSYVKGYHTHTRTITTTTTATQKTVGKIMNPESYATLLICTDTVCIFSEPGMDSKH